MSFTLPRVGDIPRLNLPPLPPFQPIAISSIPQRVSNFEAFVNNAPRLVLDHPNYANITNFTATMFASNVFARPNRFRVEIATLNLFQNLDQTIGPPGYDQNWAQWFGAKDAIETGSRLMFYCFNAEIPGVSYQTDDNRIYGSQFKVPYMPQYNDIDLEFYVGDDMFERWFFEGWMHSIMDPQTQDFNYIGEFSTSITITQMDLNDQDTYTCTLLEAFPISINQMDLNWDTQNEIHRVSVTFTYKRVLTIDLDERTLSVNNDTGRGNRERFRDTVITPAQRRAAQQQQQPR